MKKERIMSSMNAQELKERMISTRNSYSLAEIKALAGGSLVLSDNCDIWTPFSL